jgi:hypothetical protein
MKEETSIIAPHWSADAERWVFDVSRTEPKQPSGEHLAQYVCRQVWRFNFSEPGFCLLDIAQPDETEPRVVNSAMTTAGETEQMSLDQQREFVATESISGTFY